MSSCLPDSILTQTLTLQSVADWINETNKSEEVSLGQDSSLISFLKSLKDGIALCKLVGKLKGRFIMFNKNPRGIEFMEQENFETFVKEATQLITQASLSPSFISQLNGKETHKLCVQPDSNGAATSPMTCSLIRVLIQLSESVSGKALYKGPLLTVGSDSVTFVRGSTLTSVTTTRTTSPEDSKQVTTSPKSNDIGHSKSTTTTHLSGKVFKENIEPEVSKKYELLTKEDIDSVLKSYRNDQMESIKQQLEKFRKSEEDKINRELKQMRQNMINQLQREQRDFEMDMKRQAQELQSSTNNSTKPPPVSKTVVTREKRISIELPKNEPMEPKKVLEEGSSAAIQKKLEDTTEKLIATEVKYEKLLDDLKEQLSKKKKEVERLEEENMLLAKRLKKLKNIKLNDGLEELDKEDVTSKSIRSLHTLLANSGDDDDDVPNFSHPSNHHSTNLNSNNGIDSSHPVLKTRETLPSVRFLSPPLKKTNSNDDHDALIDEHAIQVEEPSLLSMSDDDDEDDEHHDVGNHGENAFGGVDEHEQQHEEPIVFQTAILKKVPSNVHRLAQPVHSSFDTDEELFESSYSDLKKSGDAKKKNKNQQQAKKSIFNSDIQ
ncbi:hypothetical protein C9374_005639 [Naegleria lovaniensis]|uniref:Calponin-homology (CH) domain-containing protein n=1 Tax=Naegleria lovaniensis TaxID=51637 RepID=A0AA88GQ47_NAELO|nr:uncharacterized protein C9374_005639 [Naegleria lovaniensis]KAG2382437.1 hypothetical protein C9374_005639 [Naegleria lovaniensis]